MAAANAQMKQVSAAMAARERGLPASTFVTHRGPSAVTGRGRDTVRAAVRGALSSRRR